MIPHFKRFPLLSGKQCDFERFARRLPHDGGRRTSQQDGLIEIVELVAGDEPERAPAVFAEAILAKLVKVKG